MTRRTRGRRTGREGAAGQMIVIFTLCLIAIISMAALLVDGGLAWSNKRQAQAAADTSALAAARDVVANNTAKGEDAARAVAQANGYAKDLVDCNGNTLPNAGVVVNRPPLQGDPLHRTNDYVEVVTSRAMRTTFAAAVGQGCWMVTSRAVASIGSNEVAQCSFCSLNNTKNNHTILLQNGARLRVDGDIYTNSYNGCSSTTTSGGLVSCNDGATCAMKDWQACGDGFDVFGTPPDGVTAYISARTISVVGGWETHDQNVVVADSRLAPPTRTTCPYSPTPPEQLIADPTPSNVCIHMPPIVDPYGGTAVPALADYTVPAAPPTGTCTALPGTLGVKVPTNATTTLTINTAGSWTICPGRYNGLIIQGTTTKAVMRTGVYYLTAAGLTVNQGASIDGSSGVMIYNSGAGLVSIVQLPDQSITPADPDMAVVSNHSYSVNTNSKISSSGNPVDVTKGAKKVTYTMVVNKSKVAGAPTLSAGAIIDFYDGEGPTAPTPGTPICTATLAAANAQFKATCVVNYTSGDVGIHGIAALFHNDPAYNDWESMLPGPPGATQPGEVVKVTGITGGTTSLKAMTSGPFAGFVIWQDKTKSQNMILSPQSTLADCTGSWMTDGIPTSAPSPCGDIGGISGTIYAGHPDSQVQITTSGLADLQVIAGRILINAGVETRFAFTPGKFALGGIRLIE